MKLALEIINREIAQRKLANKHEHLRKEICNKEIEELESVVNLLSIPIVSGSLPVYATTFDNKGELEHQRFSAEYAGEIITELSKKVNEFETFIDSFNENYR